MYKHSHWGLIPQFVSRTVTYTLYLLCLFNVIYLAGGAVIETFAGTGVPPERLHRYGDFLFFGDLLLCFCIYILLMVRFLFEQQRYIVYLIDVVHLIKGGNYACRIKIRGNNELSHLASQIDELRKAAGLDRENQRLQDEKEQELLTSVSHDLRTPLTTLTGYLEILQDRDFRDEEKRVKYLAHCLDRARQLEYLTATAFEHFYLTGKEKREIGLLRCHSYRSLLQIICKCAHIMHQSGFPVQWGLPECRYALVYDIRMMERLFDNVFTNIVRYAHKDYPVVIFGEMNREALKIHVENRISQSDCESRSTGIGLQNCRKIMSIHDGGFDSRLLDGRFLTSITFPVKNKR